MSEKAEATTATLPMAPKESARTAEYVLTEAAAVMAQDPGAELPDRSVVNMGPSHPAMHGIVRIRVELEGERIVGSDTEIGYLHRGFEKMCENRTWNQAIIYTDRLNYVSSIINNVGYAMAVEKLLGIEVPPRCAWIRTLGCEISRVADHLTCVGAAAMELGAFTAFLYAMKGREFLWELVEAMCGARVTTDYTRVGGLTYDLPPGFEEDARAAFGQVRTVIDEMEALLTRNRIFIDRLQGVGAITQEDAIRWGFTGPCLRATGLAYDVRVAHPYPVYDQVDWDIPVGSEGDNYDRYLVRMEEMRQSLRISEQCLDRMPEGPIEVDDPSIVLPTKDEVYGSIEGLMNHFKLIMDGHGLKPPAGEIYFAVEGANGELGFYIVSDGTDRPYRMRCRGPCFPMVAGLSHLIDGGMVADVVPTFGSVNMIGGELER